MANKEATNRYRILRSKGYPHQEAWRIALRELAVKAKSGQEEKRHKNYVEGIIRRNS